MVVGSFCGGRGSLCGGSLRGTYGCAVWWLGHFVVGHFVVGHSVVGHCVVGHCVVGAQCGGYAMVVNVSADFKFTLHFSSKLNHVQ